jgi:hypothetical protein
VRSEKLNDIHIIRVINTRMASGHVGEHAPRFTENNNTSNAELSLICHLLALLGAHHILHVSRIRVNMAVQFCGKTTGRLGTASRSCG